MVKPFQIRGARAILSWSQQQLAERAKLNRDSITALESEGVRTHPATLQAVIEVFEHEGLRFVEDGQSFKIVLDKRSAHLI